MIPPMEDDNEILIEMNRIGGAMEVRAIATSDGLEIVFTAPANAAKSDVEHLARAKLAYVRRRMSDGDDTGGDKPDRKGGWIA